MKTLSGRESKRYGGLHRYGQVAVFLCDTPIWIHSKNVGKNWAVWIWKEFLEDKIQLWSPPIQFEARVNDFCYQDVLQIRFLGVAGSSSTRMQSIRSPIQCNPSARQRANLANMNNQIHLLAKEPDHDLDLSILHPSQSYFQFGLSILHASQFFNGFLVCHSSLTLKIKMQFIRHLKWN